MTRIKLCGLTRLADIEAANACRPDYIGFVFAKSSRRYIDPQEAYRLRGNLSQGILAVGVFVNEEPRSVAALLQSGVIDMAQLHGTEDDDYLTRLRALTEKPLIQAFRIGTEADTQRALRSKADAVLLDSGAGTGKAFAWALAQRVKRPYFLAGGLTPENVGAAIFRLRPFAVDTSSGIESGGGKDPDKMAAFVQAVREADARLLAQSPGPNAPESPSDAEGTLF